MRKAPLLVTVVSALLLLIAAPGRAAAQVLVIPDDLTAGANPPSDALPPATPLHLDLTPLAAVNGERPSRRPPVAFAAAYSGFAASQMLDARVTLRSIERGARESNPFMEWTVTHPAAFYALKAGTIVGTIAVVEKMREHHPKFAFLFIAAIDSAYSAVVVHNYRVYRSLK